MSESSKDGCYCQKCGAPVDPTDEKCPNGHILKEVGKRFVVSAEARITMSGEAKIGITKAERKILENMVERIRKFLVSRGAVSLTLNFGLIQITFNLTSQE